MRYNVEKFTGGDIIEKIAYLEANDQIVERTRTLLAEQIAEGDVIVRAVGISTIEKEAGQLVRSGVKVIIARGGTYHDLAAMNVGVPVVH